MGEGGKVGRESGQGGDVEAGVGWQVNARGRGELGTHEELREGEAQEEASGGCGKSPRLVSEHGGAQDRERCWHSFRKLLMGQRTVGH